MELTFLSYTLKDLKTSPFAKILSFQKTRRKIYLKRGEGNPFKG
jgi:hypothetical protein